MLPHQGQQVILDAPASDIIKDLIGGTVSAVRLGEQLLHIVRIQIDTPHARIRPSSFSSSMHSTVSARGTEPRQWSR